jgi:8-oxo-dGTP pyrophosphatase MutT (NUDIX family)
VGESETTKKPMKLHWLAPVVSSPLVSLEQNPRAVGEAYGDVRPKRKTLRIHPRANARGFLRRRIKRAFSAGGVVYKRTKNGDLLWLIIRPAGTARWQFPKGLIDNGESSKEAALREVEEEGAVESKIIGRIEDEKLFYFWEGEKILKNVTFYLMEFIKKAKKGHDQEVDEAIFLPFDDAYAKLTFKNDKKIFEKAREILESGIQVKLI